LLETDGTLLFSLARSLQRVASESTDGKQGKDYGREEAKEIASGRRCSTQRWVIVFHYFQIVDNGALVSQTGLAYSL